MNDQLKPNRCECDTASETHEAFMCEGTDLIKVNRYGAIMWVCGDCTLPEDKRLDQKP